MTVTERYHLTDRFLVDEGTVFLTGIQALARLPLEQLRADQRAGWRTAAFVSGYPGSPLGGYDGAVAAAATLAPELPVICRPGVNEELAAAAVMGSQLAVLQPDCRYEGVVGIWYGKAPGVDRAADALRHAVFAGTSTRGGAVALVGDDPAAKSSTVPSSSAGLLSSMHMPLLYPGDPAEALDLGRHAIALSRTTGLWSALKIVADVADATATVILDPDRVQPIIPLVDGERYRHRPDGRLLTPHTVELEQEIVEVRYELARQYASTNALNHVTVNPPDAWIGLVASGITYREVREALARLGLRTDEQVAAVGIRLLKMGMPLPFDARTILDFADGLKEVFVIEEKQPNIESLIKDALYPRPDRPLVVGKHDHHGEVLLPAYGALDADRIMPLLRKRLERRIDPARLAPVPTPREKVLLPLTVERAPFYCSGCPHNRSTQAPEGALIGAGIGCHTMALLMDEDRVGDIACVSAMGGEGLPWVGMADFVEREHFIQNLGDGTFFHSGQLAISAAIAAGVNITYKLLWNGTVAMTGGQDPQGQLELDDVVRLLLTQGVARVLITTDDVGRDRRLDLPKGVEVWDRSRLLEAQEMLSRVEGVTVLIHDQGCAAEARRARKRGLVETPKQRVVINHRICEGCGHCGQVSNCLSVQPVETPYGRKTTIDQTTCNLDYSCLEGDCPSFMTITDDEPGWLARRLRKRPSARAAPAPRKAERAARPVPPQDLPDPTLVVPADDYALRITGIGGTGVVTVAQVLGTAAMLDGFHVRGLDQIGLSQKAGPVVSDVRLSRSAPTATNRLGEAQADLLLAFDQLTAASDRGLLTASPHHTCVVGSTAATPTGYMITHLDTAMPGADELAERIASVTWADHQYWADAASVTRRLFGSATTANIFVVGMAVQAGCLPIGADSIESAINLNGVAVDANIAAFRWGRAQIARPEAIRQLPDDHEAAPAIQPDGRLQARIDALGASPDLAADLARYALELERWGTRATAVDWLDTVEEVARAERDVDPASERLTRAVAENLFKLMAYKDEYEVARLMLDPDGLAAADAVAKPGAKVAWKLQPPLLRGMGLDRKISVGTWATPGVRVLARAKVVRGTPLDPFRWAKVRRVERRLPKQYRSALRKVLRRLTAHNLDDAVAIAALPDMVRGYEDIKLANVERYRTALDDRLADFG